VTVNRVDREENDFYNKTYFGVKMNTIWLNNSEVHKRTKRNDAFWSGSLQNGPLMWVTAPKTPKGNPPKKPAALDELWTDIDYVLNNAEYELSNTYFAGDAIPVFNPWLGPDQAAAWLGAEMTLRPQDNTSWVKPFVHDWKYFSDLRIDPENKWWTLYIELLKGAAERGQDKWVTTYPDLHTGFDGLAAIRGPENLLVDLLEEPDIIKRAMRQMTDVFKSVIDTVDQILLPHNQGTSNWSMGYSSKRYICIGQNDFTAMISPDMFKAFCVQDTVETVNYFDFSLYHLDGPDALRHLPQILDIDRLTAVQWVHGDGQPSSVHWIEVLKEIQDAGKSIQLLYNPTHGGDADICDEIRILCNELDENKLFFWILASTIEEADRIVSVGKEGG
jgi:hypothetical protein